MPTKNYRITHSQIEPWLKSTSDERIVRNIRWLHAYASEHDLSNKEIGERLKQYNGKSYSADSVYQAMTGRRTESQLENFIKSIEHLSKIERERSTITRAGFVETNTTKKIFKICETARTFGKIMFIFGKSHIGKTTALREYAKRNNGGSTIYLRAPAGGSKSRTLSELCRSMHLSPNSTETVKEQQILEALDERVIIIVDEAHQFLGGKIGLRTLEYMRELHDRSGCGMVISATEIFEKALTEDASTMKLLGQFKMRSLITAKLPDKPTKQNLNQFAKHFGLEPAKDEALDLQTEIIKTDSLGRWLSILEGASRIAANAKSSMEWEHVIKAHVTLLKLEQGT